MGGRWRVIARRMASALVAPLMGLGAAAPHSPPPSLQSRIVKPEPASRSIRPGTDRIPTRATPSATTGPALAPVGRPSSRTTPSAPRTPSIDSFSVPIGDQVAPALDRPSTSTSRLDGSHRPPLRIRREHIGVRGVRDIREGVTAPHDRTTQPLVQFSSGVEVPLSTPTPAALAEPGPSHRRSRHPAGHWDPSAYGSVASAEHGGSAAAAP